MKKVQKPNHSEDLSIFLNIRPDKKDFHLYSHMLCTYLIMNCILHVCSYYYSAFGSSLPKSLSGKVIFSLCLINYAQHHEDLCGGRNIPPPLLTSALDGGEWPASSPCRFNTGEIAEWASEPVWTPCPFLESNPSSSASSTQPDSRIPAANELLLLRQ
jgi:hypothetical protein